MLSFISRAGWRHFAERASFLSWSELFFLAGSCTAQDTPSVWLLWWGGLVQHQAPPALASSLYLVPALRRDQQLGTNHEPPQLVLYRSASRKTPSQTISWHFRGQFSGKLHPCNPSVTSLPSSYSYTLFSKVWLSVHLKRWESYLGAGT